MCAIASCDDRFVLFFKHQCHRQGSKSTEGPKNPQMKWRVQFHVVVMFELHFRPHCHDMDAAMASVRELLRFRDKAQVIQGHSSRHCLRAVIHSCCG